MNTRLLRIAVALILLLLLSACGGSGGSENSEASTALQQSQPTSTDSTVNFSQPLDTDFIQPTDNDYIDVPEANTSVDNITAPQNQTSNDAEFIQLFYDTYSGEKRDLFSDTITFVELESYRIKVKALLDFHIENSKLLLTNWVPRNLDNILIIAHHNDIWYKMVHLDKLPGTSTLELALPWNMGQSVFKSLDGTQTLDFSTVNPQELSFSYVPQDDVQQAIADIKLDWVLTFPDRIMNGLTDVKRAGKVVWRPTHPLDARYLLTFMIHAAQTVNHPKFYEFWMKTPFTDTSGVKQAEYRLTQAELSTYSTKEQSLYNLTKLNNGEYYNKAHRQFVFDKYFQKFFALGMTGGGGLGGGPTVGLNHNKINEQAWSYGVSAAEAFERDEWWLPLEDKSIHDTPWKIFGHENGHALGFNHKQSYCVRSQFSHMSIGNIIYSHLVATGQTIITPETMVGRDINWEKPYNKKQPAIERSRPLADEPFEWGGVYEKTALKLPQKIVDPTLPKTEVTTTAEWKAYIEAHKIGTGLDYIKSIQ